jgi:hypothetical protein
MSKARAKGTQGENFFLGHLRELFGSHVERAPLKGTLDYGDFVNVPFLCESKHTQKPLFQQWARVCEKKTSGGRWVVLWKGDLRTTSGNGPYVLMPLTLFKALVAPGVEYRKTRVDL